ncbi:MAG TPA: hypothetical protein VFQ35_29150, partial [Polyangiaceae bacterium]|nr:hypothetical protein [Polyangiaceae bacterium]
MRLKLSLLLSLSMCVAACGGSSKPAEEPSASSSEEKSAEAGAEKSEGDAPAKGESKEAKKEEPKEESSEPKVSRTAKDVITAPDVLFMFSWNSSDVKEKAEKQCEGEASSNPKKRAACLDREKKKIDFDGMGFKQEKGRWYWLVIKRKGKTLINLHKVPVEFVKDEEHSVVLKPAGKDEGTARGGALTETKVSVPNEYQIEIEDPSLGKVVYEAKI